MEPLPDRRLRSNLPKGAKVHLIAANDRFALTFDLPTARQCIAQQCHERGRQVERLFRRLKGCRPIFSRFENFDVMCRAFLNFALIVDMIKC